jgi:FtsZ-binding cell division protein ZapB|tara:strand:+ start:181 stop:393 length:213 start_codon:yes stop_codon:yes gene_type:complete
MRLKSLKNFKDEKKYLTYLLKDKIDRQKKLINTITVLNQEIEDCKEKNKLLEQELEAYRNIEKGIIPSII